MRPSHAALWAIWRRMAASGGMGRAMILASVVLIAGWGLLALSGWFITAAAMARLAGTGALFDVFRPGASVRGLAILRSASRYGERWLGHDATLRAVVRLRQAVLGGLAALPWRDLARLRRGPALARVISDTDALDGLPLRLVMPVVAASVAMIAAFALLCWLMGWQMAVWICGAHLLGALGAALWGLPRSARLAAAQVQAEQQFRIAALDLIAARDDLAVYGRLPAAQAAALHQDATARALIAQMDQIERGVGLALDLTRGAVAAGALGLGALGVQAGLFGPGLAAMGFFTALALGEVTMPLRRAVADYGRIRDAAQRIAPLISDPVPVPAPPDPGAALPLMLDGLRVNPGQVLAIIGPSGVGKSTLLAQIAGVLPLQAHQISLGGTPVAAWPEHALRHSVTLVPQRPALIAGSLRDNLRLADTDASDETCLRALRIACLDHVRQGLNLRLGEGGAGLSGGERRRLAIARAVLRRPSLLLLDEPSEGLDPETAAKMLDNLRVAMPETAIVMATHRRADILRADLTLELR